MPPSSAYEPLRPAKRPGGKPEAAPAFRVLVHKRYRRLYDELPGRVGLQQAQQFWDHVSRTPGAPCAIAATCILKGRAGRPQADGWSRTVHYEVSGDARIDYQYNDSYKTSPESDGHPVVAILTITVGSH